MHNEERFTQLTSSRDLVLGTVYGGKSGSEQRYWFEGTPKNIASFLMRHADADNIYITTPLDTPVISSFGCFVDQCPDRSRLQAVHSFHRRTKRTSCRCGLGSLPPA